MGTGLGHRRHPRRPLLAALAAVGLLVLALAGFAAGGVAGSRSHPEAVPAASGHTAAKVPTKPYWKRTPATIKAGFPFTFTLVPARSRACRVTTRGPGGQQVSWTFATDVRPLRLTLLTEADAQPGRWRVTASCLQLTDNRLTTAFIIVVTGKGRRGGALLGRHGDMRVELAKTASIGGRGGGGEGTGGYPYWDAADLNPSTYDFGYTSCKGYCTNSKAWYSKGGVRYYEMSERGYYIRNCTDYVAWKLESLGIPSALTRNRGDGKQWDDNRNGVTVTGTPEMGDAAVINAGLYGHVAFVEQVKGDQVLVSQYNNGDQGWGNYSYDWVPASTYTYVDFNGVGNPLVSPSLPFKWDGWIVQYDGDHKAQKTAWLVSNDSKRYWIADTGTYSCLKGKGVPGPQPLPSGVLDQLPDQTGQKAICTPSVGSITPPATTPPPATTIALPPITTLQTLPTVSTATTTTPGSSTDRTPPSVPGSLSVSNQTTTSFRLNWSASTDNVGVTGYAVYLDGTRVGQVSVLYGDIIGQACGTTHTVGVAAYDAAGNYSATASITAGTATCPQPVRVNAYDNYGPANAGRAMCRGNPGNSLSVPGGTVTQTFTVPPGVAAIDQALVQIDPDSAVVGHGALSVNGALRATADATASGDTTFNFSRVGVSPGDQVSFAITFSATFGKIITVYTAGSPGGTFTTANSCPDGAPSLSTTSTGLRAVVSGWSA